MREGTKRRGWALGACCWAALGVAGCGDATDAREPRYGLAPAAPSGHDSREDPARSRGSIGEGGDDGDWRATPAPRITPSVAVTGAIRPARDPWSPIVDPGVAPVRRGPFADGELCTFGSVAWGAPCGPDAPAACLRDARLAAVLPDGVVVGRRVSFTLTDAAAVAAAFPAEGELGPLAEAQVDPPAAKANQLAAEVAALRLNLVFSAHGDLGSADLGAATLVGGPFDGWSVATVAGFVERWVGGQTDLAGAVDVASYDALLDELQAINAAGQGCVAADYIRR